MSAITSKEVISNYVNTNIIKIGDVNHDEVVTIEFDYLKDLDTIHYYRPDCGCTNVTFKDGKFSGTINIKSAITVPQNSSSGLNKNISIYLDPEVPEFIGDANKKRIQNPDKQWINVSIVGTVHNK
jgi:hypothetical protein